MRRVIAVLVVLCMGASGTLAWACDIGKGMGEKAARGAVNLCTGMVEVPAQAYKGFKAGLPQIDNKFGSKLLGTAVGFVRGVSYAAGRTSWGALELFGFWTASPKDNSQVGVSLDAKYAWEEGRHYSVTEPDIKHGIKPVARKLGTGIANAVFGIAEIPGQALRGKDEDKAAKGLAKGVWFWLSREVYGVVQIATCIFPNPEDNPGYALYGQWPWTALQEHGARN